MIIILAAAIILALDDDPIDSAEKAVTANDLAVLKESVGIANAQYRLSDRSMTKDDYIYDYLNRNGITYDGYHIENGKLVEGEYTGPSKWDGTVDTSWYVGHESDSTYTISKASQFAGLAELVNNGTQSFEGKAINLVNDIDLNNKKSTPIGRSSSGVNNPFSGEFNGNSYTISNANIENYELYNVGLFGYLESTKNSEASIKNLILKDSSIKGTRVGGIGGYLVGYPPYTYAIIENCASVNNYIEGNVNAGGICSDLNYSKAINCYNTSEVVCTSSIMEEAGSSHGRAGGICAGCIDSGEIYGCYNTGKISAPQTRAGGILGAFATYKVYDCYNIGEISGKYTGELFGEAGYAEIKNCYYLSGKNPTGIGDGFESEDGYEYNVKAITSANLKLESAIDLLNQYDRAYEKDTQNINGGYPILSWQ